MFEHHLDFMQVVFSVCQAKVDIFQESFIEISAISESPTANRSKIMRTFMGAELDFLKKCRWGSLEGHCRAPGAGASPWRPLFRTAAPPQEERWGKKQHGLKDKPWGSGAHSAVTPLADPMEVEPTRHQSSLSKE